MNFKSIFLAFFACFILNCQSILVAEEIIVEKVSTTHSSLSERIAYLKRLLLDAQNNHRLPHEVVIYAEDSDDVRDAYEEALEDYPSIIPIFKDFPPFHHHKNHFYDREIFVPTGILDRELVFIDSIPDDYPDFYDPFWEPFFDTFWGENIPLFEGWYDIRKNFEPLRRPIFEPHWKNFKERHPLHVIQKKSKKEHFQNLEPHRSHQSTSLHENNIKKIMHKKHEEISGKLPSSTVTQTFSRKRDEQRKQRIHLANKHLENSFKNSRTKADTVHTHQNSFRSEKRNHTKVESKKHLKH